MPEDGGGLQKERQPEDAARGAQSRQTGLKGSEPVWLVCVCSGKVGERGTLEER